MKSFYLGGKMKELFLMDMKNYINNPITVFSRPSVRAVIIKDNKLAMIYSNKYDYYKFPGGGINSCETLKDALIRETREEAGLDIIFDSIKEWGHVLVKEKGDREDLFIQDNFYYFANVRDNLVSRNLDDYEEQEGYELRFVSPEIILDTNINHNHNDYKDLTMIKRENKAVELLVSEKFIKL